jgi:hypothetical protein
LVKKKGLFYLTTYGRMSSNGSSQSENA